MANEPKPAEKKRPVTPKRQHGQGDHEGSPHDPEEFLRGNPPPDSESEKP